MLIDSTDKARVECICRHEVGHWLVAREMGFATHEIKIVIHPSNGNSASSSLELWMPHITDLPSTIQYIRKRLMVLYAGAIAESFDEKGNYNTKHALNEWENGGAKDDYAKIRELTHILRNLEFPNTTNERIAGNELLMLAAENCQRTGELLLQNNKLITKISYLISKNIKQYNHEYEISSKKMKELYRKLKPVDE